LIVLLLVRTVKIDWFVMDPDLDKAWHEMMQPDTVLLERITYQLFDIYWLTVTKDPNASKERILASELNR
jgi:hypothetical protein